MIDNKEQIKRLLSFEDKDDFYQLYVFKRKKDQVDKENHQSVRTIKTYCISSLEYLDKRWDEITHLCEYFKARAYININKNNPYNQEIMKSPNNIVDDNTVTDSLELTIDRLASILIKLQSFNETLNELV